jgi:predicted ATPase
MRSGAVELFAARAQAAAPHFALGPDNVDAIVEICRRLDGIPLAIELAAARVPLLGVEGLRARLGERFNVLTAGARAVLRRHQTLRATLEWSHGLLTAEEQRVFRRLGVFAGSFTLEAAQHVARDAQIDGWAALDHLGALVDKSLVLAEGDPVPRYRLLETTRAYALERLGEASETAATLRCMPRRCSNGCGVGRRLVRGTPASVHEDADPSSTTCAPRSPGRRAQRRRGACDRVGGHSSRVWHATHQLHEGLERCLGIAALLRDDCHRRSSLILADHCRLGMYTPGATRTTRQSGPSRSTGRSTTR